MAASFQDVSLERFRSAVRSWVNQAAPLFAAAQGVDELREIEIRRAWETEVYRAGYSCLSWPTEFGGQGLGPIEEFVFAQECAEAGAPEGLGRVGRLLAAPALFKHGTAQQQARFLPPILEGREIWCQGFSEPGAGSDVAGVRTAARHVGDRYLLNGQKLWISFGHYADWSLLIARTGDPASRHRGLTMFCLPMHQRGVSVRGLRQITGKAEFNEIFLDDAEIPVDCRIGDENEGWAVAITILTAERGAGFGAIALKEIGDDLAVVNEHCILRRAELRAGARQLATRLHLYRWQIMRALEAAAGKRDALPSSSILKLTWSELARDVARLGFASDCAEHVDRWRNGLLKAQSTTIVGGTSDIQRNIIAERVLGLPR